MRNTWIVCISLLLLAGSSCADDDEQVEQGSNAVQYTKSDFDIQTKTNPHFVMFYAPWCGHCKNLAPTFDQLAEKYNVENNKKDAVVAKVDCTEETALCSEYGVTGYPTLKFLNEGSEPVKYSGPRTLEALDKFIQDKVNPAAQEGGDGAEISNGLYTLTAASFDATLAKGLTFVKFYAPWCGHCKRLAPTWESLASEYKDTEGVKIAKVDCTEHGTVCQTHAIRGYPTLVLFKDGQKVEQYQQSREQDALSDFIKRHLAAGEDKEEEEDEEDKKEEGEPEAAGLSVLTSNNFDEIVKGEEHAFIKFYAPWCGHCKALAPVWDKLAEEYTGHDNVIIGKVDCTENQQLCADHEVRGYPTLHYFHNGVRAEKYQGSRAIESLVAFMDGKLLTVTAEEREVQKEADVSPPPPSDTEDGSVVHLNGETFQDTIAEGTIFVKFFAPWCGHCKAMVPAWKELSDVFRHRDDITIAKVDCTLHEKLCENQEVDGFPTVILYQNGKKVEEYEEDRDVHSLRQYVMDHLPKEEL